jgi:phosphoribosyl 1,2-cyclic phosphodiesterase
VQLARARFAWKKGRVRAFVLATGSTGNAVLVEAEGARVLVDAGIGPKAAEVRLAGLGAALLPRGVDAIVATHEHGDHFGQVERLARALKAPVYLHGGIAAPRVRRRVTVRDFVPGEPFRVGPLEIGSVTVPHDAPQVAIRVASSDASGHALGIATDVGHVTPALVALLATCDAALVEANHCRELLAFGPYPPHLQARVAGHLGHLSNAECAELAARLVGSRIATLWLGHLSRTNNTPARALEAVRAAAPRLVVEVLEHGASAVLEVRRGRPFQLALGL